MLREAQNHILICNWSRKGEKIIKELHSLLAVPDTDIIVLSNPRPGNEQWLREHFRKEYSNVEFREGTPVFYEALKGAGAHKAMGIIILSNPGSADPDAEAVLITLAISTIWKKSLEENSSDKEDQKKKIKKPRITVEVQDPAKMRHMKDAGADDLICAEDYAIGILSQSAINEKLSDVYHSLLTYCEGTNEIYIIDKPEISQWMRGKTFTEISMLFLENRLKHNPAILLGFRRENKIMMNPKEDIKFSEKDALIVLAYDIPDVMEIIAQVEEKK